jgi:uncharacterized protein YigE (DUF2233 family)
MRHASGASLRAIGWLAALLVALLLSAPARAQSCAPTRFDGASYTVCLVDPRRDDLRLFWRGADGKPYGALPRLADALLPRKLRFAMNAGMYQADLSPVGLYIEDGRQLRAADQRAGASNFHLKPNGVFYFGDGVVGIAETSKFLAGGLKPRYATQSGPMLVIDGHFHPKIHPTGSSEKIRNGVGVRDGATAIFAISDEPVSFYAFARLFRDALNCPNALFLDGSISSLYAPALGRTDGLWPVGPIVGVVEPAAP